MGELGDVDKQDNQGGNDINHPHKGHQLFRHADNPLAAAHQADQHKQGKNAAQNPRRYPRLIEGVNLEGGLQIIGAE